MFRRISDGVEELLNRISDRVDVLHQPRWPVQIVWTVVLLGGAFGIRYALHPLFGTDRFVFTVFYLAIVLIALVAGMLPALIASVIAAPLAYWAFAEPAYSLGFKAGALAAINFFVFTAVINLLFIMVVKRLLAANRAERLRAEELARGHADLFAEFNARAANHLQLVAALLGANARESDGNSGKALSEASRRTDLISRLHRTMDAQTNKGTNVAAFAAHLLEGGALVNGTNVHVTVSRDPVIVRTDQATSIAILLMEASRQLMALFVNSLTVTFAETAEGIRMKMHAHGAALVPGTNLWSDPMIAHMVAAAVAQVQGVMKVDSGGGHWTLTLDVPAPAESAHPIMASYWTAKSDSTRH